MNEENNMVPIDEKLNITKSETENIKNLIYTIRGKQVMLDSDVAMLYHYPTKRINEAVRRNIERFPENFCFKLTELEKEIYKRASAPSNKFEIGCYYHIEAVVKNAQILAQKFGADEEVVIISAWLHDIASITDYNLYELHHIHGANIAENILKQFNYEEKKINKVKECILNHRGSVNNAKLTIEEKCVADADAISHFDSIPSLLYLAYVNKHMNIEEGRNFVVEKLKRSYNKLSDASKEFYKDKYDNAMELL